MGGVYDQAARAVATQQARAQRRRVLAQAARIPALAGAVVVAVVATVLSGWAMLPWVAALLALLLLALTGFRRRLGPWWTSVVTVLVADVGLVGWYVDPWWWAVLAGLVLTGAAAAAGYRLRLRTRRRETLGAAALGVLLLAGGIVGLAMDAAAARAAAERDLQAAHDAAVPKILPRTPNSMVAFLVERIGHPTPANVADVCFVFAPAAQHQLAAAHVGPDCPAAVRALATQVRDPLDYINNLWLPGDATTSGPNATTVVDACRLDFSSITDDTPTSNPGPQLGRLTLQQQHGEGQLIIGYQPCPPSRP
ncbi:MAG TPA: hypothetical protein VGH72_07535 [Pseudonocardia sp.]